jgi:hypothetical protein
MVDSKALSHLQKNLVAVPERPKTIFFPHGLDVYAIGDEQRRVALAEGADVGEGDFDLLLKAKKVAVEAK